MTSVRGHARKILVLLCAIAAALLVVAPAGLAHTPSIDWRACEDAEGFECATVKVPRNYSRPSGSKVDLAVVRLPAQDEDARIRLAVRQLRRAGRRRRGDDQGDRRRRVRVAQRPLRHRRLRPERHRGERGRDRLQGQPGDPGVYRQPFPTPESLDVSAWVGVNRRYVQRCVAAQRLARPGSRHHRQRGPRHEPVARRGGRPQADLPGVLVRHRDRGHLRESVPPIATGRSCSTGHSTWTSTSTGRCFPCASSPGASRRA